MDRNSQQQLNSVTIIKSTHQQQQKKNKTKKLAAPSIILRLIQLFQWEITNAMLIKCLSDLLQFANPILLK
jgi:hypothetical protein